MHKSNIVSLSHKDSVMLGQATDAAVVLGIASEREINVSLKLNCLFFERSVLPVMHLIGGQQFLNLYRSENNGFKDLISQGLVVSQFSLRPEDTIKDTSAVIVAKRMVDSNTLSAVTGDDLIKFAQFLDSAGMARVGIQRDSLKVESRKNCVRAVTEFARRNSLDSHQKKTVREIVNYCETAKYFSESEVWRILNLENDRVFKRDIQIAVSSATLFASSILSNVQLSTTGLQTDHIDNLRPHLQTYGRETGAPEFFDIEGRFNLDTLLSLPLSEITQLRNIGPISAMRKELIRVRNRGTFSERKLQNMMDECAAFLEQYYNESKVGKRNLRGRFAVDRARTRIRVSIGGVLASVPMIEFFLLGGGSPLSLLTLAGGAYLAFDGLAPDSRPTRRTVFSNSLEYRAADGAIRADTPGASNES